jgi:hypothetical protein
MCTVERASMNLLLLSDSRAQRRHFQSEVFGQELCNRVIAEDGV